MPSPPQNRTTFTTSSPSEDLELREGDHQSPTPLAYVLKLGADLLAQVPRHDQHVVGAGLGEGLDGMDRDVRPRQVLPVLVRVPVDAELDKVAADATVVEQGVPLAR